MMEEADLPLVRGTAQRPLDPVKLWLVGPVRVEGEKPHVSPGKRVVPLAAHVPGLVSAVPLLIVVAERGVEADAGSQEGSEGALELVSEVGRRALSLEDVVAGRNHQLEGKSRSKRRHPLGNFVRRSLSRAVIADDRKLQRVGFVRERRSTALPLDTDAATAIGINHVDIDRRQAPVGTAMTDPPRKSTSEEGAKDEPRRPFDEFGKFSRQSRETARPALCPLSFLGR